jgi:hypothetical protein
MKYWADGFRTVQKNEKELKVGIVAANNHYAGFGAATANMLSHEQHVARRMGYE